MEGADDMVEFEGRGREDLGLNGGGEGETITASAVEGVARPTGAYFFKCALQFTQMLFSTLCSAVYKDATKKIVNLSHCINNNTEHVLECSYSWICFCAEARS